jgi:hypothetical protein
MIPVDRTYICNLQLSFRIYCSRAQIRQHAMAESPAYPSNGQGGQLSRSNSVLAENRDGSPASSPTSKPLRRNSMAGTSWIAPAVSAPQQAAIRRTSHAPCRRPTPPIDGWDQRHRHRNPGVPHGQQQAAELPRIRRAPQVGGAEQPLPAARKHHVRPSRPPAGAAHRIDQPLRAHPAGFDSRLTQLRRRPNPTRRLAHPTLLPAARARMPQPRRGARAAARAGGRGTRSTRAPTAA